MYKIGDRQIEGLNICVYDINVKKKFLYVFTLPFKSLGSENVELRFI